MRTLSRIAALIALAGLVSTGALADDPQNADDLSYDQLMRYSTPVRKELFGKSTPASKARLNREQLERGLATYRPHLTPAQVGLIEKILVHTVADAYGESEAAVAHREAARPLMEEAQRAFDKTQFVMLFTLNGAAFPNREPAK